MTSSTSRWWLRGILSANSLAGLRELITIIAQRNGFKYFVFRGRYPQWLKDEHEVRLDNCPKALFEDDDRRDQDPMHHRAMQEATPVLWRDWLSYYPSYFSKAREHGLITGVTSPVYGPVGDRSSISFIKGVGGLNAEREIQDVLPECQLITCYVHRAVARVVEKRIDPLTCDALPATAIPALTERERECLTWVATGKTAAQVAATLSLSEATIIYHLTKARRKLAATNSRHAISKALSLRLIAPS